jgi:two-component system, sensor histidine kinase
MQAHLAKPVMMTDLARTLQRWLPTRIIEASSSKHQIKTEAEPSASPRSPPTSNGTAKAGITAKTWAQWIDHRCTTIAAIAETLELGRIRSDASNEPHTHKLVLLMHNLAGTAAAFGEVDLGNRAAALEQALRGGAHQEVCEKLARELLAVRDAAPEEISQSQRQAR